MRKNVVYIYIYIERERERERESVCVQYCLWVQASIGGLETCPPWISGDYCIFKSIPIIKCNGFISWSVRSQKEAQPTNKRVKKDLLPALSKGSMKSNVLLKQRKHGDFILFGEPILSYRKALQGQTHS
jgi:hypothetical protein